MFNKNVIFVLLYLKEYYFGGELCEFRSYLTLAFFVRSLPKNTKKTVFGDVLDSANANHASSNWAQVLV